MFCPNCGNQVNNNDVFCGNCGSRISGRESEKGSSSTTAVATRTIEGDIKEIKSKISLRLETDEKLIEQYSAAFVMSSIAQGTFSLTNKRIIFTKDSGGMSFLKRGGLIGVALNSKAIIPNEISLNEIVKIEATSCVQGKGAMLITTTSGSQYKIALQSMAFGKTKELCEARDRIICLINSVL